MPVPYLASALVGLGCYLRHNGDHSFISQPCVDQYSAGCRARVRDATVMGEALTQSLVLGRTKKPLQTWVTRNTVVQPEPIGAQRSCLAVMQEKGCMQKGGESSPHPEGTSRILINKLEQNIKVNPQISNQSHQVTEKHPARIETQEIGKYTTHRKVYRVPVCPCARVPRCYPDARTTHMSISYKQPSRMWCIDSRGCDTPCKGMKH